MNVGVLITNGGPHPADKWAVATAEMIFPAETASADNALAAKRFQLDIAEILEGHHAGVATDEKAKIAANAAHIKSAQDYHGERADKAVADIVAKSKGTPFEAYFAREEWQAVARPIIGSHFATNADIHRSWHADANPESEPAKTFRANRAGQADLSAVV